MLQLSNIIKEYESGGETLRVLKDIDVQIDE